jgi:hypothetical protein
MKDFFLNLVVAILGVAIIGLVFSILKAGEIWHVDNNLKTAGGYPLDWNSRLVHTDKWKTALKRIDVYYLRLSTARKVDPRSLVKLAQLFKQYNIKLALDEPLATWAGCRNNRNFSQSIKHIKALKEVGFDVKYIGLQSVLSKPYKKADGKCNEYRGIMDMMPRYKDILAYYQQVQPQFPDISIGIIDATPVKQGHPPELLYNTIYNGLRIRGYKLGFIHLDIPMTYDMNLGLLKSKMPPVKKGLFIVKGHKGSLKLKISRLIDKLQAGLTFDHWINADWYPEPKYSTPDTDPKTGLGTTVLIHNLIEVLK